MSSSHAPVFKFRHLYHMERAGGRYWWQKAKAGMGQEDVTSSGFSSGFFSVIQAGDPLIRLNMYYPQENQTPSPARSHSLTLLERTYVFGILP